jgi:hypothetical protein
MREYVGGKGQKRREPQKQKMRKKCYGTGQLEKCLASALLQSKHLGRTFMIRLQHSLFLFQPGQGLEKTTGERLN